MPRQLYDRIIVLGQFDDWLYDDELLGNIVDSSDIVYTAVPRVDGEPSALARLLAVDAALRVQREDRQRAQVLLYLIATYVEDYGNG